MFLYSPYNISPMSRKMMALLSFSLMIISLSILLNTATKVPSAEAAHVREITASNSTVWYGGEKIGNLTVGFSSQGYEPISGGLVNLTAHVAISPAAGSVLEGWLINPDIPTYYNLTLGQFVNGTLRFDQYMVNPAVYKFFVVSQEQIGDTDPRMSDIILGGSEFALRPDDIVAGSKLNLP
ncbi:MAG: hypothetical protein M3530_00860 [Thermoproteota archaeon]|nr:hypothetical protein [Thermoproteota archaeon]